MFLQKEKQSNGMFDSFVHKWEYYRILIISYRNYRPYRQMETKLKGFSSFDGVHINLCLKTANYLITTIQLIVNCTHNHPINR